MQARDCLWARWQGQAGTGTIASELAAVVGPRGCADRGHPGGVIGAHGHKPQSEADNRDNQKQGTSAKRPREWPRALQGCGKTWCGNGGGADVAPAPRGRQGLKIIMFVRGLFLAFLGHFALPPYLPVPFSDPFSPPLPLVGIICITHQHQKIASLALAATVASLGIPRS